MRLLQPLSFLIAIIAALPGFAQTSIFRVVPATPNSNDVIVAQLYATALCEATLTTTVTETVVRTEVLLYDCIGGPPPFNTIHETQFGPLAAGTYTYEVYSGVLNGAPPVLVDQQPLVVAPAPAASAEVPTLGPAPLLLLGIAISIVAFISLRRVA